MKLKIKKLLIDLHLYLGVTLCLFFAAWFVSGVAMMYYTTPILQPRERHALAAPIPWKGIKLEPYAAVEPLKEARIGSLLGRPVLRVWPSAEGANWKALYLDDGKSVDLGLEQAEAVAKEALGGSWAFAKMEGPRDWTQHGALNPHVQAYRFKATDGSSRQALISKSTGEPIYVTHKGFEFLYFIGPIIHYYTLKSFRDFPAFWSNLVDWSSFLGILMCIFGLALGVWFLRWEKVTVEPKKAVPYNDSWMWLHHAFGMLFGVLTFSFVMSGLFSMNPLKIFPSSGADRGQAERFSGGAMKAADFKGILTLARLAPPAHEVTLSSFEGSLSAKLWTQGRGVSGTLRHGAGGWDEAPLLGQSGVKAAVKRGFPESKLKSLELLDKQDAYYYERPEKRRWRNFPVYRARLEGKPDLTLYVGPETGEIYLRHSPGSKLRRWLYNGLHSFDFMPLYVRPWWDILVILMSIAGLALSVTGVVISWRWFKQKVGYAA